MRRLPIAAAAAFVLLALLLNSCSEDILIGERQTNRKPEVWLSSGPVEGDTTGYQIHFYWGGWDPDGEVDHYEFVVSDGDPFGFNPDDTTGVDKWYKTTAHDSVIRVTADIFVRDTTFNYSEYSYYDRTHTFFIRAVDKNGARSDVQYRSFTAWTLAPVVNLEKPAGLEGLKVLNRVISFSWRAKDPIDSPNNVKDPDSIRYLLTMVLDTAQTPNWDIVEDLNRNPMKYEHLWSKWVWYRAPEDSGKRTIIGDDEVLQLSKQYIFALQAKDEAGAVTAIFKRGANVAHFSVSGNKGPSLTISERFLGSFKFIGETSPAIKKDLPPGVPLQFKWVGDAESYGGEITGYSYGWDVEDVNNPNDWEVYRNPMVRVAPEKILYSGVHTFFVEASDNANTRSIGQIEVNIIPFTMERNLLWVDDFYSIDFPQVDWATPTETQHDEFWIGLCSKAEGFDPERDVFDCAAYNFSLPEIALISKYKNIIWTYSNSENVATWPKMVKFLPESQVSQGTNIALNYLPLFLAKGGHLMTLGQGHRKGGLAAVIPVTIAFPMYLKCEITGNTRGCEGDTSGVYSLAYKDYCVSMLDKVSGSFRDDADMPPRRLKNYDVLKYAYKDTLDPVTASYPELPEVLNLWSEVTATGRFYDPNSSYGPGGFDQVEVYDPEYWMSINFTSSQPCFHPMYRMRSKNTGSAVNRTTVALWVTKYEDIIPDVKSGVAVAAPSVHFGFPLWYFDHDAVNQIIDVIFSEWGILDNSEE